MKSTRPSLTKKQKCSWNRLRRSGTREYSIQSRNVEIENIAHLNLQGELDGIMGQHAILLDCIHHIANFAQATILVESVDGCGNMVSALALRNMACHSCKHNLGSALACTMKSGANSPNPWPKHAAGRVASRDGFFENNRPE